MAPGACLGEAFIFRVPETHGEWFARALRCEGIDARNLGPDEDVNVRVFWNWRFLFAARTGPAIKACFRAPPVTCGGHRRPALVVPAPRDCDHLVAAVRKVAGAMDTAQVQSPDLGAV